MNESTVIDRTLRLLKRHYYGNIIFLAVLFLAALLRMLTISEAAVLVSVTVERYALMITIIAIPVALKLFADRLKKFPGRRDPKQRCLCIKKYLTCACTQSVVLR